MLIKNVVLSVFLIFSLGACTEPPPEDTGKLRVIEVTDHEFKINGESAVTLIIGRGHVAEYSFSIRKSDLKKGTLLQSVSDSNPNVRADATFFSEYYVQSKDHDTHVSVEIVEIDPVEEVARIAVGAKLVNLKDKDFKELEIIIFELTGQNLENLLNEVKI
ncbi:hypothetical protein [Pseudoalteromonas gelatinilytica]|uniref:Lipoprotein n=1 Tax=Pseudoalteromonas gelatinilytica TaxID=1703256 RepID=A0ABQ1TCQ9_9GAMM|nr:hypothetical protein [Pseudoalteromonas profundi]GGE91289.1 hypothetical protein GCM10008027_15160 [Pseudoalteromonas profundi]